MMTNITELQKSALAEAGNIGSGHAAIALSQLMGRKIMIAIPSMDVVEFGQLNSIIKKHENIVQVSVHVLGDIKGIMVFTIEDELAMKLCDIVMGIEKGSTKILGDLEQSALKEIGSILTASYMNAISEMTGLSAVVSVPDYHLGNIELLEKIAKSKDITIQDKENVLCIRTEFIEASTRIEGYLIFVPANGSITKIINALGV